MKPEIEAIWNSLTPMGQAYFTNMCRRGWTRTDEGGMADTVLSGLCSKPSPDNAIVRWEHNRDERGAEWPNKYLPTALGLEVYNAVIAADEIGGQP